MCSRCLINICILQHILPFNTFSTRPHSPAVNGQGKPSHEAIQRKDGPKDKYWVRPEPDPPDSSPFIPSALNKLAFAEYPPWEQALQGLEIPHWKKLGARMAHLSWRVWLGFKSWLWGWERKVRYLGGSWGLCDLGQVILSLCKLVVVGYNKIKTMFACQLLE